MAGRQRELRKARRRPKRQAAWISYDSGDTLVPCVIWDLSEEGARLGPARAKNLPDVFNLVQFTHEQRRHVAPRLSGSVAKGQAHRRAVSSIGRE